MPTDPDWAAAGGTGANPFSHDTPFTSVFQSHPGLVGYSMWDLINGKKVKGSEVDEAARHAANHLIAAYLDAAFSSAYVFTTGQLKTKWGQAVAANTKDAFNALKGELDKSFV